MKKKKLYLTAFLLVLALALQGGIFSGFSVPVQAAATSKKQTGFVKKNGSWYYYDKNGKKATGWKSVLFRKDRCSQSWNSDHQWKKVLF